MTLAQLLILLNYGRSLIKFTSMYPKDKSIYIYIIFDVLNHKEIGPQKGSNALLHPCLIDMSNCP